MHKELLGNNCCSCAISATFAAALSAYSIIVDAASCCKLKNCCALAAVLGLTTCWMAQAASVSMTFICPYCIETEFSAPSEGLLLSHVRLVHSLEPNFRIQCTIYGCSRTFNNFRTYQNHRLTHRDPNHRIHQDDESLTNENMAHDGDDDIDSMSSVCVPTADSLQSFAAKWILKTSETRSLTRKSSLGIVADVVDMVEYIVECLKDQTWKKLVSIGTDPAILKEIFTGPITRPFQGLTS